MVLRTKFLELLVINALRVFVSVACHSLASLVFNIAFTTADIANIDDMFHCTDMSTVGMLFHVCVLLLLLLLLFQLRLLLLLLLLWLVALPLLFLLRLLLLRLQLQLWLVTPPLLRPQLQLRLVALPLLQHLPSPSP